MSRVQPAGDHLARQIVDQMGAALDARPILVTSDFDGTLSVPRLDPWAAAILPRSQRALRGLAALDGVHVAFLSGRTASDLSGRVRVGGATYVGNQGLERGRLARRQRPGSLVVVPHPAPEWAWSMSRRLALEVPRVIAESWLVVEDKGPAVTFHYRAAPDVAAAAARVAGVVERVDPDGHLVRFPGRRSLELRPAGAPAKGEAFRRLLDDVRPQVAFMLGDDRTDASAFRVLRAAREAGEIQGLAIAVGSDAATIEDALPDADVLLGSPSDVARFLDLLGRALAPGRPQAGRRGNPGPLATRRAAGSGPHPGSSRAPSP